MYRYLQVTSGTFKYKEYILFGNYKKMCLDLPEDLSKCIHVYTYL